jgi:hypothetical protein
VTTNGVRNVVAAEENVPLVVTASTGRRCAYSPDVYTASKRVAEWIASAAAARGGTRTRYAAARFTHVVDNSIIHQRLLRWSAGGMIRLHSTHILFYAQSALESAQLLLCAGLGASPGSFRVHAINDLGWPVNLLDMALGVLRRTGSATPIYFSGYDSGYEDVPFPGLYDPDTAGDVSPLLSALEADRAEKAAARRDAFSLEVAGRARQAAAGAGEGLSDAAGGVACNWTLSLVAVYATLRAAPATVWPAPRSLTAPPGQAQRQHRRMLAAFERYAGVGSPANRAAVLRWCGTTAHGGRHATDRPVKEQAARTALGPREPPRGAAGPDRQRRADAMFRDLGAAVRRTDRPGRPGRRRASSAWSRRFPARKPSGASATPPAGT